MFSVVIALGLLLGFSLSVGFKSTMTGKTSDKTTALTATASATRTTTSTDNPPSCSQVMVERRIPRAIAIDAENNLYVTNEFSERTRDWGRKLRNVSHHGILKFTKDGKVSTVAADSRGIAVDKAGNLYATDAGRSRILKITPKGKISTVAGNGKVGHVDGPRSTAQFSDLGGIAIDATGNLYVTDVNRIRKVTPKGEVSTLAGDDKEGFADGTGTAARFRHPADIAIDKAGNLYVTDTANYNIRKITQKGVVTTFAGSSTMDRYDRTEFGYIDGQGNAARFYEPYGIAIDAAGNLYVADATIRRIRKVTPEGVVSTFAGSGYPEEYDPEYIASYYHPEVSRIVVPRGVEIDGARDVAQFEQPYGITIDARGNLYVTDGNNPRIRKVTPTGEVSTLTSLGKDGRYAREALPKGKVSTFVGSGKHGLVDSRPVGTAKDKAGNLYTADSSNHRILKTSPGGEVSTFAGNGERGFADGVGSAAQFALPSGIAIDKAGNLYVTDYGNNRIRKVTPAGEVSTLVGSDTAKNVGSIEDGVRFYWPYGITIDKADNLYVTVPERILKVTLKGEVSAIAGGSERGFADGVGSAAQFGELSQSIVMDAAGNLYVADRTNHRIRKISPTGEVSTLAGDGKKGFADGQGSAARFAWPSVITMDAAGNLYVTDAENSRTRKITPAGMVSTTADSAQFYEPDGIAIDKAGNLYVADSGNHRIRKVSPAGEVSTFAGKGDEGFADGAGSAAQFSSPSGIVIDAVGNLYVADSGNHRIRKVSPAGEVSTYAGKGEAGFSDGTGSAAQFGSLSGIAIDTAGNLYVADSLYSHPGRSHRIRKVTPAGIVTTLAGSREGFFDGVGADAQFRFPNGIAIDAVGNLYVTESGIHRTGGGNHSIRKITPTGEVSTLVDGEEIDEDSVVIERLFIPKGIAIDAAGNLYVTDCARIHKIVIE